MEFILESFRADWETFLRYAPRLLYAAVVLLVAFIVGKQLGRLVGGIMKRRSRPGSNYRFFEQLISWVIGAIGILLALGTLGFEAIAASMLATGGVVAIVAGFAFREIGENFLAGFFLSFSRPFELNDLIKTGDLTGTVKAIELRNVHIRTADACDVFVPSAKIFREPLYNYTRDGLRRPGFTVGVAYHDEPDRVLKLLEKAVLEVPGLLKDPTVRVTVKEFGGQYIEYEVFFWIDINRNEAGLVKASNDVKISCWRALSNAGMTFSTDVTSGISIQGTPELKVNLSDSNEQTP